MQCELKKLILSLLCGFLVMNSVVHAFQQVQTDRAPLQIRLRPITEVTELNVRLTDIATFFQDDRMCTLGDLSEDWQRQLRRVEVVRLTNQRRQAMVFRNSVNIRLQVLGAPSDQFELIGPEVALVTIVEPKRSAMMKGPMKLAGFSRELGLPELGDLNLGGPEFGSKKLEDPQGSILTDLSIERAIRDELTNQFGIAEDGLQVRLLRSVIGPSESKLKSVIDPVIQVTAPVKMPYGRHSLLVRILDGQRIAMMQSVTIDVRLRQNLIMARRPISAGTKIDASMLTAEVRFTDRHHDQLLMEDVIGLMSIRPFQSNEIVSWNNLRDPSSIPAAQTKPIINARDAVKVVASHKSLRIAVSAAEAMESGRMGQLIRVRNIQSRKVFSARVIRAGEVELIL